MARYRRTRCPAWAESGERLDVRRGVWCAGARYRACKARLAANRRWACHVGCSDGLRRSARHMDGGTCVGASAGRRAAHRRGVLPLDTQRQPRHAYQHTGETCRHRTLVFPDGDSARSGNDAGASIGSAMSCRRPGTRDHCVRIIGSRVGGCRCSYDCDAGDYGCHCDWRLPWCCHAASFAEWRCAASGLDGCIGCYRPVVDSASLDILAARRNKFRRPGASRDPVSCNPDGENSLGPGLRRKRLSTAEWLVTGMELLRATVRYEAIWLLAMVNGQWTTLTATGTRLPFPSPYSPFPGPYNA